MKCTHLPQFDRDVKRLRRKHRHVEDDMLAVERLLSAKGQRDAFKAVLVPGMSERRVWKGRAHSRDLKAGASGAFRVWWLEASDNLIVLIYVYTHSDAPEEQRIHSEVRRRLSVNGY